MRLPIRQCVSVSPILGRKYFRARSRRRRRSARFKKPRSRNGGRSSKKPALSRNDLRQIFHILLERRALLVTGLTSRVNARGAIMRKLPVLIVGSGPVGLALA